MQVHNWHALGWLVAVVINVVFFALWEWLGMNSRTDNRFPLTHYVRATIGTWHNPLWWITGAMLIWLFIHFLFLHDVTGAVAVVKAKLS